MRGNWSRGNTRLWGLDSLREHPICLTVISLKIDTVLAEQLAGGWASPGESTENITGALMPPGRRERDAFGRGWRFQRANCAKMRSASSRVSLLPTSNHVPGTS